MSSILGIITARGNSKGLPRKNVKTLGGQPLISWTIQAALDSKVLDRIIVSTEDEEIADVSRKWGAEVPFIRPESLARDETTVVEVVEHVVNWFDENERYRPSHVMVLQPTSPFRTADDIRTAVEILHRPGVNGVVAVNEVIEHPYFCKTISKDGVLSDFIQTGVVYHRRQDVPPAYITNGALFVVERQTFLREKNLDFSGAHAYIMPHSRSLDINTAWDFYLADLIVRDTCKKGE